MTSFTKENFLQIGITSFPLDPEDITINGIFLLFIASKYILSIERLSIAMNPPTTSTLK